MASNVLSFIQVYTDRRNKPTSVKQEQNENNNIYGNSAHCHTWAWSALTAVMLADLASPSDEALLQLQQPLRGSTANHQNRSAPHLTTDASAVCCMALEESLLLSPAPTFLCDRKLRLSFTVCRCAQNTYKYKATCLTACTHSFFGFTRVFFMSWQVL